jgi:hypothetical protein
MGKIVHVFVMSVANPSSTHDGRGKDRSLGLERQLDLTSTARNLNENLTRLSLQPDSDARDAWFIWVKGYLRPVEALIRIPDVAPQNEVAGHLDWAEENFKDLE